MIFIATISQPKKISIFNKRTSVKIVVAILLCLFLCPILISAFSSYPFLLGQVIFCRFQLLRRSVLYPAHLGKQLEKGISVTLTPNDLHRTHTFQ